jgi:hypothetical protein
MREVESVEATTLGGVPATRVTYKSLSSYKPTAVYVDGCTYCETEKAAADTDFPSHFAGRMCESGKRNHCTCSACW